MEILWCAKAPRADIYSQFVSALRTTAGCVKRRSRRVVAWGGQGRSPLHVLCGTSYPKGICSAALHCRTPPPTHLVIASQSAPRSKCPWGTDWRGNPFFQRSPPLDKPVGMGIIIDTRGRCDKRSAPLSVSDLIRLYSLQKPSPAGVAVFVFQLHNTNRNGIPPDVESKYPVHVCHPLSGL